MKPQEKRIDANRQLLETNFGRVVRYKATDFRVGEVSYIGGFYITALETTKNCRKGDGQYVSRATLLRLLAKPE
jgi:hypothetical protein